MTEQLDLGGIAVDVVFKNIKNIHLSVNPPLGRVRIAAPLRMNVATLRIFAISKLAWIKQQQKKLREQHRETRREFLTRESHYVWGKRYLLSVTELDQAPTVTLKHARMILSTRAGASEAAKEAIVAQWYRDQIRETVPELIAKWETTLGVNVNRVFVQQMKTKWGSCNPKAQTIRLNTELAKKPKECLEYIVVHEMAHLLEPSHNVRFVALMDRVMPKWGVIRRRLNSLPVSHADWDY